LRPQRYTLTEYALLFQQGEEKALEWFYLEFHPVLLLYANNILKDLPIAEEVTSDAFIKTWKHHAKLDSFGAIRAYLYKVTHNGALQAKQKMERRNFIEKNAAISETDNYTPFEHTVRAETYHLVHAALKELAPGNQRVIKMYYLDGKSSGDIARELKLSANTVKSHKKQGLAAFRKKLISLFC
jgi:RNA polymerase sigma factor (sigma-70 family)